MSIESTAVLHSRGLDFHSRVFALKPFRDRACNINTDKAHSVDRGLWQINNYWHPDVSDSCAYSASCNANAAKSISSGGSNWTPWATYNGGAYKRHLATAEKACGGGGGGGLRGGFPASSSRAYDKIYGDIDPYPPGPSPGPARERRC